MPYQVGAIAVYLVLAVVLEALRGTERRGYLHLWALGLVLLAVQTAVHLATGYGVLAPTRLLAEGPFVAAILATGLGGLDFAEVRLRPAHRVLGAALLAGLTGAYALGVPVLGSLVVLKALLAVLLAAAGVAVFLNAPAGRGRWLVLAASVAMGAFLAALPGLQGFESFDQWEVEAGMVLTVFGAFSVLVVHFERARARERATADRYRSILEHAPVGLFRVEPASGRITAANPALRRMLALDPGETLPPFGRSAFVKPRRLERLTRLLAAQDGVRAFEAVLRGRTGAEVVASIDAWVLRDDRGAALAVEGIVRDLTEERRLQSRLLRAQRLEALGRLSAGVAHDFNNLLTGALAASELTLAARHDPEAVRREMEGLQQMIRRGSDFTRQLLAFGRRAPVEVGPVDLDGLLRPVLHVLDRVLGPDVRLELDLSSPPPVRASVSQLEQLVTNLVINARDAMPSGGRLLVRTRLLEGARRVRLTVQDDGVGMDERVRARIFEPFFTTKAEGQGTGLGLAGVWGTVKQLDGEIRVESAPGQGTTFEVDLPVAVGALDRRPGRGGAEAAG